MSRRIISTISGKGRKIPATGPPTFWPLMVGLRTIGAYGCVIQMLINSHECGTRLKAQWKSNLLPSWNLLVLNSFCQVLWLGHYFKGCTLPSSLLFHLDTPKLLSTFQHQIKCTLLYPKHPPKDKTFCKSTQTFLWASFMFLTTQCLVSWSFPSLISFARL